MLGDSITEGCEWSEIFTDVNVVNRGISGDTSIGVLKRLNDIIMMKPKKVLLMIGINDVCAKTKPEDIVLNVKKICNILKMRNIEVVIQSVIYVGSDHKKIKNEDVKLLNKYIRYYCIKSNVVFVDLNQALSPKGYLDNKLTVDGMHLNGDGYLAWSRAIKEYVYIVSR